MLVGRRAERAKLDALVDGVVRGQGSGLLLTGEPGIGKTELLDDLLERRGGEVTVLRTAGREGADLPFAALAELVAPVHDSIGELPEPQARALRRALALEAGGGVVDSLAVGVAALGLFLRHARRKPVLVVVDDLQWVDEPSRAALHFAARRLDRMRVALLCAAREGQLADVELEEMPVLLVTGLRARPAGELLARSVPAALASTVRRKLLELSSGNPLALIELPTGLTQAQLSGDEPLGEPIPVNGGIERTFGARVARLPEATRRALLLAAAVGAAEHDVLSKALEHEGLDLEVFAPAVSDRLVSVAGGAVEFRHPLVRSVVYHAWSEGLRRSAHALLADVESDPDRRAWHLVAATVAPDERVAAELDAAAERALARGAPASAAQALDVAAGLTDAVDARAARLARAARAAHRAGDVPAAGRLVAEANGLTDDPVIRADLLLVESDLRMRAGDFEGAHRELIAQAERLLPIDPRRATTLLLLAAKFQIYRLAAAVAADDVERALTFVPAAKREMTHLAALSMSRAVAGREGAREAALAAAEAASRSPHGHAHTNGIAWPLIWLEEYDAARDVTRAAISVQREAGFLLYLPQALLPQAELDFRTGRWTDALGAVSEALELFDETRQPTEAAAASAVLSRMEAARGNTDACRTLAERALASDVECGLRSSSAHALAALGLLELGARRPAAAISPLEAVERIAARGAVGEPWMFLSAPDLVEAHARAGNKARAEEILRAFEERIDDLGRISASAAAARCAGIVGETGDWRDAFDQALALHAQVPTPFERARTELCYGERLRRTRKRVEARQRLRTAREIFQQLGAAPWVERAEAELRASGETRRLGSTPSDALTPQELSVTKLVTEGATNREAAAALFVSEKTVEFHLGNVYRKLGIRSRSQLARSAAAKEA